MLLCSISKMQSVKLHERAQYTLHDKRRVSNADVNKNEIQIPRLL